MVQLKYSISTTQVEQYKVEGRRLAGTCFPRAGQGTVGRRAMFQNYCLSFSVMIWRWSTWAQSDISGLYNILIANLPQWRLWRIEPPCIVRTVTLSSGQSGLTHLMCSPLTLSITRARPVEPNVSIAKYSPSSIFVWSSVLTSGTDFPPPCTW